MNVFCFFSWRFNYTHHRSARAVQAVRIERRQTKSMKDCCSTPHDASSSRHASIELLDVRYSVFVERPSGVRAPALSELSRSVVVLLVASSLLNDNRYIVVHRTT